MIVGLQQRRRSVPAGVVRGFSLVEVLVSITIFLVGAVLIVYLFPRTLEAAREAELQTKAAFLAQMKAEEIRRDDDQLRTLGQMIAKLGESDPENQALSTTDPIVFPLEPDLSYVFYGKSVLYANEQPPVPEGDAGVARVLILRNRGGQPPQKPIQPRDVIYELRFAP